MQKLERRKSNKKNYDYLIMLVLYVVTFGLLITNTGLFWDDFTVFDVGTKGLEQQFGENGYLTFLWLLKGINALFGNEAIVLRTITFISYLVSAIFLYMILQKIKEIDRYSRLFIVITFMVFPVNFARISIVNANHAMNYLLFFLGFFLLMKYLENKRMLFRCTALFMFFLSFFTPSYLVFYLIVVFYLLYIEKVNVYKLKQLTAFIWKYIDFILLPIVYWIIKKVFIKTTGHYADYNELSLDQILKTPEGLINALLHAYVKPFFMSLPNTLLLVMVLVILWAVLIFVFKRNKSFTRENVNVEKDLIFMLMGFVFFILGVFAYVAVDKTPSLDDWNSRQQLLVPLGASFITFFGLRLITYVCKFGNLLNTVIYTLILSLFITSHITVYYDYHRDWIKQLSLMEHFKESQILAENNTFVFEDHMTELNTLNRNYRFYEYTGLLKMTFNEETRLGTNTSDLTADSYRWAVGYDFLILSDYNPSNPQYKVIINKGNYQLDVKGMTNLIFNKYFDKEQYQQDLMNVTTLEYVKF
jgi:hypothetical protein